MVQVIGTTINQSKSLLKLGVDFESADLYWTTYSEYGRLDEPALEVGKCASLEGDDIPAWSLGRLYEMVSGIEIEGDEGETLMPHIDMSDNTIYFEDSCGFMHEETFSGDGIIETFVTCIEPAKWIKPKNIEFCKCGWIAPNGDVYGCSEWTQTDEHITLAEQIVERRNVKHTETSYDSDVEKAGYVKFSPNMAAAHCSPSLITEAQREQVVRYMEAMGFNSIQLGWCTKEPSKRSFVRSCELANFRLYITH